jgi:hypothetical protein
MSAPIREDIPVCWLEPRIFPEIYRGDRAWFLCPVFAHKVLLAESMVQGLNMVERVVLDLARAGVRSRAELASRAGLPVPLVHLVVDELIAKNLLSEALVPTEGAERELEEAEDQEVPDKPAVVFTNPWTGLLWPRVALGEPPQAREFRMFRRGGELHCRFTDGPIESPVSGEATALPFVADTVRAPRSRHILEALRLHRRAYYSYRERNPRLSEALKPISAARAILCNAPPVRMYMLTYGYVPSGSLADRAWTAADPFGLGRSDEMARIIRGCSHAASVGSRLQSMIDRATERVGNEARDVHVALRGEATENVRKRLGVARDELFAWWQPLFDLVVDAEVEFARSGTKAGELEGNVASKVYLVLEELLKALLVQYGPPKSLAAVADDDRLRSLRNIRRRAAQLGFDVSWDESQPSMFAIGWGRLNAVVNYDGRGVAPLLAACVLAATEQQGHPLDALARHWPGALDSIERVIRARNPESHGELAGAGVDGRQLMDGLYRVLDGLSSALGTKPAVATDRVRRATELEDLQLRIRVLAIHSVQSRYGADLEFRPRLSQRLERMENRLEWIKDAQQSPHAWSTVRHSTTEFMREAAPAVECVLAELLRAGGRSVAPGRASNDRAPEEIAVALGFAMEKSLIYSRPDKVKQALQACRGSLAELTRAALLAAESDPDHPLRDLASTSPRWLDAIAAVEQARGHADKPLESAEEAVRLAESVHVIVQDALDAMKGRRRAEVPSGSNHHVEAQAAEAR